MQSLLLLFLKLEAEPNVERKPLKYSRKPRDMHIIKILKFYQENQWAKSIFCLNADFLLTTILSKVPAPPPQGDTGTFSHYLASCWVWQYTYVDTGQKTTINSRIPNVQKSKVRVLDHVKVKECVKHLFPHLKKKTGGASRAKPNREEDDKHIFLSQCQRSHCKISLSCTVLHWSERSCPCSN